MRKQTKTKQKISLQNDKNTTKNRGGATFSSWDLVSHHILVHWKGLSKALFYMKLPVLSLFGGNPGKSDFRQRRFSDLQLTGPYIWRQNHLSLSGFFQMASPATQSMKSEEILDSFLLFYTFNEWEALLVWPPEKHLLCDPLTAPTPWLVQALMVADMNFQNMFPFSSFFSS